MNIAFRIEKSSTVGLGHFMRMSTLAAQFEKMGHRVEFFDQGDEPVNYTDVQLVIIDSYQLSDRYISNLKRVGKFVVCYDDNSLYTYDCHVLLNANLHASQLAYRLIDPKTHLMLGPCYALLREDFEHTAPIKINSIVKRVFVCFGGSDINRFTPWVVSVLQGLNELELVVVLGSHTDCDQQVLVLANDRTKIYKAPKDLTRLMRSCDLAVIASGSMVYELASMGLPSIVITQADNQLKIANYLQDENLMTWLGDWDQVSREQLQQAVQQLARDILKRVNQSKKLQQLVNRKGASKAAEEIIGVYHEYA